MSLAVKEEMFSIQTEITRRFNEIQETIQQFKVEIKEGMLQIRAEMCKNYDQQEHLTKSLLEPVQVVAANMNMQQDQSIVLNANITLPDMPFQNSDEVDDFNGRLDDSELFNQMVNRWLFTLLYNSCIIINLIIRFFDWRSMKEATHR